MRPVTGNPESPFDRPRDPGLQPERTSLAWRRTLLALLIVDFLLIRAWFLAAQGSPGISSPGAPGLAMAVATAVAATVSVFFCMLGRARTLQAGQPAVSAFLVKVATASVVLLAVAVTTAILLT